MTFFGYHVWLRSRRPSITFLGCVLCALLRHRENIDEQDMPIFVVEDDDDDVFNFNLKSVLDRRVIRGFNSNSSEDKHSLASSSSLTNGACSIQNEKVESALKIDYCFVLFFVRNR